MSTSRKTFLAGMALGTIGTANFLPEAAAAGSESATILTLFLEPKDAAAFDEYYLTKHEPLIKQLPGIVSYSVSQGAITQTIGASIAVPSALDDRFRIDVGTNVGG